jgi:hypothetical protein
MQMERSDPFLLKAKSRTLLPKFVNGSAEKEHRPFDFSLRRSQQSREKEKQLATIQNMVSDQTEQCQYSMKSFNNLIGKRYETIGKAPAVPLVHYQNNKVLNTKEYKSAQKQSLAQFSKFLSTSSNRKTADTSFKIPLKGAVDRNSRSPTYAEDLNGIEGQGQQYQINMEDFSGVLAGESRQSNTGAGARTRKRNKNYNY